MALPTSLIESIAAEIKERVGIHVGDDSWNPDAHIEIVLRASECRMILEEVGMFKPQRHVLISAETIRKMRDAGLE